MKAAITPVGQTTVSLPDLRALLRAVENGSLYCPVSESGVSAIGLTTRTGDILATLGDFPTDPVIRILQTAIAERTHGSSAELDFVWTGPASRHAVSRDTATVVRQLFKEARRSVLIGGFRFDNGESLFEPLYQVMKEFGVEATLFLDIDGHAATASEAQQFAVASIRRFLEENWPFGDPQPRIFYDPRTAAPGPPWVSLHAKCVVVDDFKSFLTSANFTHRGQMRNIEAGILVEDKYFADRVLSQWHGLINQGLVKPYDVPVYPEYL